MYFDAIDVKIKAVEVVSCFSRLYAEIIEPIDYTPEWTINGNDVFYRTIMSSEVPGPLFTVHAVRLSDKSIFNKYNRCILLAHLLTSFLTNTTAASEPAQHRNLVYPRNPRSLLLAR